MCAQDYEKIDPTDRLSIVGLKSFAPGVPLAIEGKKLDGTTYKFPVRAAIERAVWVLERAVGAALRHACPIKGAVVLSRAGKKLSATKWVILLPFLALPPPRSTTPSTTTRSTGSRTAARSTQW